MSRDSSAFARELLGRLCQSDIFATYCDAFRTATGLPLLLVDTEPHEWCLRGDMPHASPFCHELSLCLAACRDCIEADRRLMEEAALVGPTSCQCFAGMAATAVPVRAGGMLIGFLKTGQVFTQVPAPSAFESVAATLRNHGLRSDELEILREAYFQTQAIEPERYESMVTLLASFAEQLGKHAERLPTEDHEGEHAAVARAKRHIEASLPNPLPLAEVAAVAGLSASQFCRVFKAETGLTLVDYINRRRIETAKRQLLKPGTRISEVAFAVGFQSVSQFNRCFSQLTGHSPSRYRDQERLALAS